MHHSSESRFHRCAPPQRSSPELAPVTIWWRGWYQSTSRSVLVRVLCVDRPRSHLMSVSGDHRRAAAAVTSPACLRGSWPGLLLAW
jgi:hypothetical protein